MERPSQVVTSFKDSAGAISCHSGVTLHGDSSSPAAKATRSRGPPGRQKPRFVKVGKLGDREKRGSREEGLKLGHHGCRHKGTEYGNPSPSGRIRPPKGTCAKRTRCRSRLRLAGKTGGWDVTSYCRRGPWALYTEESLVNAAFLLLASAWSAGQPAPAPVPAPAYHHNGGHNGYCGHDDCCDRGRFWDRCRGWFQRDRCCHDRCHDHCRPTCHVNCCRPVCQPVCRPCPPPCQPTCRVTCARPCPPVCHQPCHNVCRDRCRDHCRDHCRVRCHRECHPRQDCCDDCCRTGFFDRLRGLFRRHNHCDDCCHNGWGHNGHNGYRPGGEPIPAPKKMPGGEPPAKEVRIISPPVGTTVPAAAPALEVAPAIVPQLDADNRNPF